MWIMPNGGFAARPRYIGTVAAAVISVEMRLIGFPLRTIMRGENDIVTLHQFGAYTDCFVMGPACLHKR
jgi:hypothetical protein